MLIKARFFATLRQYVPQAKLGTTLEVDLPEGACLRDLLARFEIPEDVVKLTYVNGRSQELDFVLHAQDEVGVFPPVGGG